MEIFFAILAVIVVAIVLTGKSRRASRIKKEIHALVHSGRNKAILHDIYFEAALKFALESGAELEHGQSALYTSSIHFTMNIDGKDYYIYFAKQANGSTYLGVENADESRRLFRERIRGTNSTHFTGNIDEQNVERNNIYNVDMPNGEAKATEVYERVVNKRNSDAKLALNILSEADPIYTNSIGMDFSFIPAGSFQRDAGNIENQSPMGLKITISKPFYLSAHPVTQEQWIKVMGSNPSKFEGETNPVDSVSWNDIQDFIKRLNALEGHDRYRLPMKMEWELAAKGGMNTRWFFGDDADVLSDYAWFGVVYKRTMPVGQKKPNPFKLYDLYGNVYEWVQDWRHYELPNGELKDYSGPSLGEHRALCGGSWISDAKGCLESFSLGAAPDESGDKFGFRLALSIEEKTGKFQELKPEVKPQSLKQEIVNNIGSQDVGQVLAKLMELRQDVKTIEIMQLSAAGLPISASDHERVKGIHNLMHKLSELTGQTFKELFDEGGLQMIIEHIGEDKKATQRLRLMDVVKKTNDLSEGIFANVNNDLNASMCDVFPPLVMMAYGYAKRTTAAGLFLQGIFSRDEYNQATTIFKALQQTTGQSVEFQKEAAAQSCELLESYDKRLDKNAIVLITSMVANNQAPVVNGKQRIPYEVVLAAIQGAVKRINEVPF